LVSTFTIITTITTVITSLSTFLATIYPSTTVGITTTGIDIFIAPIITDTDIVLGRRIISPDTAGTEGH
jgi:hypothetical protein